MHPVLPFLLTVARFNPDHFSHTLHLPHVDYGSAVRHIHSPEFFLPAHGLAYPGFWLDRTHPPVESRDYQTIALEYRTCLGRYHARVFTNNASMSEFLVLDDEGCVVLGGRLRVARHRERGVDIVCSAARIRPVSLVQGLLAPWQITPERVALSVAIGACREHEDNHLRAYRSLVLRRCSARPDAI